MPNSRRDPNRCDQPRETPQVTPKTAKTTVKENRRAPLKVKKAMGSKTPNASQTEGDKINKIKKKKKNKQEQKEPKGKNKNKNKKEKKLRQCKKTIQYQEESCSENE